MFPASFRSSSSMSGSSGLCFSARNFDTGSDQSMELRSNGSSSEWSPQSNAEARSTVSLEKKLRWADYDSDTEEENEERSVMHDNYAGSWNSRSKSSRRRHRRRRTKLESKLVNAGGHVSSGSASASGASGCASRPVVTLTDLGLEVSAPVVLQSVLPSQYGPCPSMSSMAQMSNFPDNGSHQACMVNLVGVAMPVYYGASSVVAR